VGTGEFAAAGAAFRFENFKHNFTPDEKVVFPFQGNGDMRGLAARECAPIFFGLRPKKTAAPREKKGALCVAKPRPKGLRFAWLREFSVRNAVKVR